MSYQGQTLDSKGEWSDSRYHFETIGEAEAYNVFCDGYWREVRETRIVQSDDLVTHTWDGRRAHKLEEDKCTTI